MECIFDHCLWSKKSWSFSLLVRFFTALTSTILPACQEKMDQTVSRIIMGLPTISKTARSAGSGRCFSSLLDTCCRLTQWEGKNKLLCKVEIYFFNIKSVYGPLCNRVESRWLRFKLSFTGFRIHSGHLYFFSCHLMGQVLCWCRWTRTTGQNSVMQWI